MRLSRRINVLFIVQIAVVFIATNAAMSSASTTKLEFFPIVIDDTIYQWDDESLALEPIDIRIDPFPAFALISPDGQFIAYQYEHSTPVPDQYAVQNLAPVDVYLIDLHSNEQRRIASQTDDSLADTTTLRGNLTWSSDGETLLWQEYVITPQHTLQQVMAYDVDNYTVEPIPITFIGGDGGLRRAMSIKAIADHLVLFDIGGVYGQSLTIYSMDGTEIFGDQIFPPALHDAYNRFDRIVPVVVNGDEQLALYYPSYNQWDVFDVSEGVFTPLSPSTVIGARNIQRSQDGLTLSLEPTAGASEIVAITEDGQQVPTGIPLGAQAVVPPSGDGILYVQDGLHYWHDGEAVRIRDLNTVYTTLPFNMMQRVILSDPQLDLPTSHENLVEHHCDFDPLAQFSTFPSQMTLNAPANIYVYDDPIRQFGGRLEAGADVIIYDALCSVDAFRQIPSCFWHVGVNTERIWIETDCGLAAG